MSKIYPAHLKKAEETLGNLSRYLVLPGGPKSIHRMRQLHFDSDYLAASLDPDCTRGPSSPELEGRAPVLETNAHLGIFVCHPSEARVENRIRPPPCSLLTLPVAQLCSSCWAPPHEPQLCRGWQPGFIWSGLCG